MERFSTIAVNSAEGAFRAVALDFAVDILDAEFLLLFLAESDDIGERVEVEVGAEGAREVVCVLENVVTVGDRELYDVSHV